MRDNRGRFYVMDEVDGQLWVFKDMITDSELIKAVGWDLWISKLLDEGLLVYPGEVSGDSAEQSTA